MGACCAPADPAALNPTIEKALDQGVKVVYIDRPGGVPDITYVGTDNEPAAALGAQHICDNLEEGSDVAILQGVMAIINGSRRAPMLVRRTSQSSRDGAACSSS